MAKLKITHLSFYRQRHVVSFIILILTLLLLLGVAGFLVPGGVSQSERQSVVNASAIQWGTALGKYPEQMAHFPYHLFQRGTTELFGVSQLSIKLPSLILGFLSILALYTVLSLWFKRNVALITSVVATTCGQFLLLAQLGTPRISYIFLSISLLFCASMLTQSSRYRSLWFILTALLAAAAVYTPMLWYLIVALMVIGLVHPHSRFIILHTEKWALLLGGIIFVGALIPLGLAIANSSDIVLNFLGINDSIVTPNIYHFQSLVSQYVGFMSPSNTEMIAPAYGMGIMLLVILGMYRLFSVKYTAKSYIITAWLLLLIPALLFFSTATTLTYIPIMLLVAFAFDYLFSYWYSMFPLNPYARIAGLVPLSVLIMALAFSNISRFVYGYHYSSDAAATFSHDLQLLDTNLSSQKSTKLLLSVAPSKQDFYSYYLKTSNNKTVTVTTNVLTKKELTSYPAVITDQAYPAFASYLDHVIVSDTSNDAGRFYIYKYTSN